MAPRIRLSIAKPLPTITEAWEDTLEDIMSNTKSFENIYVSPGCCSGEDYLQSICQLAKPTIPVPPGSQQKIQDADTLEMLHNGHRVSNLLETPKIAPKYKMTNTLLSVISLERNILDHAETCSSSGADPLEDLYANAQKTHYCRFANSNESIAFNHSQLSCHGSSSSKSQEQNIDKNDIVSFPRFPSPRPMQKGKVCPELKSLQSRRRLSSLEHGPNQKENDPLIINGKPIQLHPPQENQMNVKILRHSQREQQALVAVAGPEKEQSKSFIYNQNVKRGASNRGGCMGYFHFSQKATTCHWISEYQCAWKAAMIRACLLPAISES